MSLRSDLGRVRGLGSAKEGVAHWWAQRVTAVALVPLKMWFLASLASLAGAEAAAVRAWVANPFVAVTLVLLIGVTFYHALLGMQVVIEDYIHAEWVKVSLIMGIKFGGVALAAVGIFAVLKIALAG